MDNTTNIKSDSQKTMLKTYYYLLCIINVLIGLIYCIGIADFFGKKVSMFYSISLLVSLFNIGKAFYRGFFGTVLGALYIVFLVIIIKNIVKSFIALKTDAKEEKKLKDISAAVLDNIVRIVIYMTACGFVKEYSLDFYGWVAIIIGVIVFISSRLIAYSLKGYTLAESFIPLLQSVIFILAVTIIAANVQMPLVNDFITECKSFPYIKGDSWNNFNFITNIVELVLWFLLAVFVLHLLKESVDRFDYFDDYTYFCVIRILKISIIIGAFAVFVYAVDRKNITLNIIPVLIPYLAAIFASIVLFISTNDVYPKASNRVVPTKPVVVELAYTMDADKNCACVSGVGTAKEQTKITIPDSYQNNPVKVISEYAFSYCDKLTDVILPNGITSIGYYAFNECSVLTSITIPNSVISIGKYAFYLNYELKNINYGGTKDEWKSINKGSGWSDYTGSFFVNCVDGRLTKNESEN